MDTKALRQKILDLAIRGKLVPQDPNDEPASVLLERIRAEKRQMVKDGKLKPKDIKNDTVIFKGDDNLHYEKFSDGTVKCIEDEIPFDLPEGWELTTLGGICSMQAGSFMPASNISSECGEGMYPCYGGNGIRGYVNQYSLDGIYPLIGRQGALCGNINMAHGKFYATEHAVVVTKMEDINLEWLFYLLCALNLNQYSSGAAQPGLAVSNLLKIYIDLPPKEEQKRIAKQIKMTFENIDLLSISISNISNTVQTIKSKVLDLAIRGKLVPQDPNDEPASVLLERIRTKKEELIKQGKIKRDKRESVIFKGDDNSYYEKIGNDVTCIDDEIPFYIPDTWSWTRISTITDITMGSSPKSQDICNDNRYIEFHQGKIYFSKKKLMKSNQYTRKTTKLASKQSVLLCVRAPVGELNITDRDICIGRGLASIKSLGNINEEFIFYWLHPYKTYLVNQSTGSTFSAITSDAVRKILIPLPPLMEQKKILDKIQKVFALLENLETVN